jgi:hypothetical protein
MALPKLNEKLVKKVLEHIKAFPEAYEQCNWARPVERTKKTPCGAAGCFAGWAVLLSAPKSKRHGIALQAEDDASNLETEAMRLLGLTENEAGFLFDVAYGTPKQNYKVIVKRLTHIRESRAIFEAEHPKLTHEGEFNGAIEYDDDDEAF